MGYIGARRGFGLRENSHWERCKARAKAGRPLPALAVTQEQLCIEEDLGDAIESFKLFCSERSADYWHDVDALKDVPQLETPGQDPERPRKLAESAEANVMESAIVETLQKHFTQIDYSKTHDGIEPIHMRGLKELAMQGSLPALSDLFAQREKMLMKLMQDNESLKSQVDSLKHQRCVQPSETLTMSEQAGAPEESYLDEQCQEDELLDESNLDKQCWSREVTLRDTDGMMFSEVPEGYLDEQCYQEKLQQTAEMEHKQSSLGAEYESETCLLANQLY
jgi:hypothetical protein